MLYLIPERGGVTPHKLLRVILTEDFVNGCDSSGCWINAAFYTLPGNTGAEHGIDHGPDMVGNGEWFSRIASVKLMFDVGVFPSFGWLQQIILL